MIIHRLTGLSWPLAVMLLLSLGCKRSKNLSSAESQRLQAMQELVAAIAADDFIGTRFMARIQTESPAYTRRQELMQIATDSELIALLQHDHVVLMLTAFEGLHRRKHPETYAAFTAIMPRNEKVSYIQGDIYTPMPVLEYAYTHVLGYTMPGEREPYVDVPIIRWIELDKEQQNAVEDLIRTYRQLRN